VESGVEGRGMLRAGPSLARPPPIWPWVAVSYGAPGGWGRARGGLGTSTGWNTKANTTIKLWFERRAVERGGAWAEVVVVLDPFPWGFLWFEETPWS